jgi:phosphoglycolate phosphatase-like HAD superfamily hydrolase
MASGTPVRGHAARGSAQLLRAVLFDMDGTLVETEHYWDQSLAGLAERLGGQ